MPYIVTKRELDETSGLPGPPMDYPEAHPTLSSARDAAAHLIETFTGGDPDYEEIYTDAQGCSELGDTFGPLQDGRTVIVVEQVECALATLTPILLTPNVYTDEAERQIIEAYEAEKGQD